jgi:hypothetical protein
MRSHVLTAAPPHLLEARAAKADRRVQKFVADARVHADGDGDLLDIRARLLAQRRDRVDRRNALREEGVGDQLGQLRSLRVRQVQGGERIGCEKDILPTQK